MTVHTKSILAVGAALVAGWLLAADSAPAPHAAKVPSGLKELTVPEDNPLTQEKVELGRILFFDPRLSIDDTVSCASCHNPKFGWSNGEAFATGVRGQKGGRSAPTVINSGYQSFQFWDGRAWQLEGQALGPIQNPIEMDMKLDALVAKLNKIDGYRERFQKVFGTDATPDGIAKAIASFERTVLSGDAPYDRFKANDAKALSPAAQRGMKIFFNKGHCSACHSGHNFTDGGFHNLGVNFHAKTQDVGRFSESKQSGDTGSFKTPTLREIGRTAPYMHDGSLKTLEEVVNYYNKGGTTNPYLDEEIFELKLTKEEAADLVVFLREGLSSAGYPDIAPPAFPK